MPLILALYAPGGSRLEEGDTLVASHVESYPGKALN
jgi:hypothetical protein